MATIIPVMATPETSAGNRGCDDAVAAFAAVDVNLIRAVSEQAFVALLLKRTKTVLGYRGHVCVEEVASHRSDARRQLFRARVPGLQFERGSVVKGSLALRECVEVVAPNVAPQFSFLVVFTLH